MFVPGEHYKSGALQAQSSSAYSSSIDEGLVTRNTVYSAGSGAFLLLCRVDSSMDLLRAPGGSRESVKLEFKLAVKARAPMWGATPVDFFLKNPIGQS